MKRLALLAPMILAMSSVALAQDPKQAAQDDPKQKPWVLNMKAKHADWHAKWEKAFDALQAARAALKPAHEQWKEVAKAKDVAKMKDLRPKVLELRAALWKAEIDWQNWHVEWKKFQVSKLQEGIAKHEERIKKLNEHLAKNK